MSETLLEARIVELEEAIRAAINVIDGDSGHDISWSTVSIVASILEEAYHGG